MQAATNALKDVSLNLPGPAKSLSLCRELHRLPLTEVRWREWSTNFFEGGTDAQR